MRIFFLLCKRKWLNVLKKNDKKEVTNLSETLYKNVRIDDLVFETEVFEEKQIVFENSLAQLGKACQELLKTSFSLPSLEEVAKALNVSYAYVRKKKSLCTADLTKIIQSSNLYKNLKK